MIETLYFTKLAASLAARNNKKYTQILTRLYGGKEELYSKLKGSPQATRGLFHGTDVEYAPKIDAQGLKANDGVYGRGVYFGDHAKATREEYFRGALYKLKGPAELTAQGKSMPDPRLVFSQHPFERTPKAKNVYKHIKEEAVNDALHSGRLAINEQLQNQRKSALVELGRSRPAMIKALDGGTPQDAYAAIAKSHPDLGALKDYNSHIKYYKEALRSHNLDMFNPHDSAKAHAVALMRGLRSGTHDEVNAMSKK